MKITVSATMIIGATTLYGCGASIPECNTADAQNNITAYYYNQSSATKDKVEFTFNRITTESVNKDTKFRRCAAQITTRLTPAMREKLALDSESNNPENVMADVILTAVGIKPEANAEIIYYIKFDEKGKSYFIEYPDPAWPKELILIDGFASGLLNQD
jgi:hypothetical protein